MTEHDGFFDRERSAEKTTAPAEVPVIGVETFAKLNSPTGVTLSAGARHIDRTPSRCVTTI